jgi:hypothetical protein
VALFVASDDSQGYGGGTSILTRLHTGRSRSYFTTDGQSVSQSVSMSWCRAHSGIPGHIVLSVGMLLSESCSFFSVGHRTGLQFAVQSLSGPSRTEPVTILY